MITIHYGHKIYLIIIGQPYLPCLMYSHRDCPSQSPTLRESQGLLATFSCCRVPTMKAISLPLMRLCGSSCSFSYHFRVVKLFIVIFAWNFTNIITGAEVRTSPFAIIQSRFWQNDWTWSMAPFKVHKFFEKTRPNRTSAPSISIGRQCAVNSWTQLSSPSNLASLTVCLLLNAHCLLSGHRTWLYWPQ